MALSPEKRDSLWNACFAVAFFEWLKMESSPPGSMYVEELARRARQTADEAVETLKQIDARDAVFLPADVDDPRR